MPIEPGTRLGVYEITGELGAGGMGEVYQARDTALSRDVAIKVMPDALAGDPDRLARFQREAEALAALNHPNIAQVYGLERTGDTPAIVMELVAGPTLAERIEAGAIPLAEAMPIARQIAEALEAAHQRGIIHRDLKPANVKVREDGTVKVLDFGLAKAMGPVGEASAELANSPTLTARATEMGMILGTAAYMAPEQAKGKHVDKRADVWAFGVVLYEMLTGQRLFSGEDVSETLAAVLRADPDWTTLPADTPPAIRRLLRRALQRKREDRLADMTDARLEIADVETGVVDGDAVAAAQTDAGQAVAGVPWKLAAPLTIATLLLGILGTWLVTRPAPPAPGHVAQFEFALPEGVDFTATGRRSIAVSPDGSRIVFAANDQLWTRLIDDLVPTPIPNTEGGRTPFFSPDGNEIGFYTGDSDQLKRVAVTGGASVPIGPANNPYGASWADNGTIYFGQGETGIWQVPAAGGTPEVVIEVEDGERAHGPQLLPGGEWLLFTLRGSAGSWSEAGIVAQSLLNADERVMLVQGGTEGRWVPTGHLVYVLDSTLYAVAFDPGTMDPPSGPAAMVEGVRMAVGGFTGAANYGFADNGSLVYIPGAAATAGYQLAWVHRNGQEVEPLPFEPRNSFDLGLSPDGRHIAVEIEGADGRAAADIWIYEIDRGGSGTRLTTVGDNENPVWSPDGEWVYFSSDRAGNGDIWRRRVDRSLEAELVLDMDARLEPAAISADHTMLLFTHGTFPDADGGILALDALGPDAQPEMLVATPAAEFMADFSPDGRFVAFDSDETGQFEVYVMNLDTRSIDQVSTSVRGGLNAHWSQDGEEIYYASVNGPGLLAATVTLEPFSASDPIVISDIVRRRRSNFDVANDGQRFLVTTFDIAQGLASDPAATSPRIRVVLNWFEDLRARVPVR